MSDVTRILNAIERGDAKATDELLPLVYKELRFLAAQKLAKERPGQTLQATALVHEAYLRLVEGGSDQHWSSRGHFFKAAAEAMRRILVESARRKGRLKRGGGRKRVELHEGIAAATEDLWVDDLIALDAALAKLAQKDKLKSELVTLRYFAGLTGKQAADVLGIPHSTADEYWAYARAWLHSEIAGADEDEGA
jgi:RNA polymerase sigma factor (TIGR02999 family)